jgi:hypothetical protein
MVRTICSSASVTAKMTDRDKGRNVTFSHGDAVSGAKTERNDR